MRYRRTSTLVIYPKAATDAIIRLRPEWEETDVVKTLTPLYGSRYKTIVLIGPETWGENERLWYATEAECRLGPDGHVCELSIESMA